MKINETTVEVVHGSVTDQDVDGIVNAANTGMRGGGGIDGRIHAAAGPGLLDELRQVAPNGAKTGTAVITRAHNLPQKHIIHTPGPVWSGGSKGESELLASCYRESLRKADEYELESIAFCSISTGIYGYPIEEAARIAVETVADYLRENPTTSVRRVVFAMFGQTEHEEFTAALEEANQEGNA